MVGALEAAGHECVIHLYDPHGVDLERYTRIIRRHWPEVRADVADVDDGIRGTDAVVATSWQTAHVLGSRPSVPGRRYYFVQDYEPYFYPRGSEYSLAEDTYRFGFEILALGHMVHDQIRTHTGVDCTLIPFGRDTEVYSLRASLPRNGIAFYSRPDTARRGSALAALGIDRFHARRPDQVIHLIGERPPMMTADVVHHGHREPYELAALYNSTICGIGMSFTNISLVVEEMLSCGSMVLVNDSPLARADVTHPGVTWVRPTPTDIANALCAAVDTPPDVIAHRARRAASHVSHTTWGDSGAILVSAIERSTRSGSRAPDHEDVR
ncbi:glycosyltransferase family 1 protein [Rhodococcus sp. BP-316]|uniref:rhamnosyltransferase WsaF family glycosyltransferase n=1 Tax=Rhodococcus sp. BP-316 TaxID=2739445 RepID=UPI001C9B029E|nr:hypothetical protein [Rhodococcus sp. BP-316]MBY6680376.1 glycosyltransferase family 1 protein [Rhodococcus sp. BP-316]